MKLTSEASSLTTVVPETDFIDELVKPEPETKEKELIRTVYNVNDDSNHQPTQFHMTGITAFQGKQKARQVC